MGGGIKEMEHHYRARTKLRERLRREVRSNEIQALRYRNRYDGPGTQWCVAVLDQSILVAQGRAERWMQRCEERLREKTGRG